jgi:hypothetical protein
MESVMKYEASFEKAVDIYESYTTCGLFSMRDMEAIEYFMKSIFDAEIDEYHIVEERVASHYENMKKLRNIFDR